jgi:transposase
MDQVSTIGLDIAKIVFQVHGIDETGEVVVRQQLRRRQVLEIYACARQRRMSVVGTKPTFSGCQV